MKITKKTRDYHEIMAVGSPVEARLPEIREIVKVTVHSSLNGLEIYDFGLGLRKRGA